MLKRRSPVKKSILYQNIYLRCPVQGKRMLLTQTGWKGQAPESF